MDQLWFFLGRIHPAAVHLPIGVFALLALVELAALFPRVPRLPAGLRTFILTIGVIFAAATAGFGWLLAREGGYDVALLDRHRWLGLTVAVLAAVMLVAHLGAWRRTYATLLMATMGILAWAGHVGGTLTHGENYLSPMVAQKKKTTTPIDPAKALVFADVVHPILQERCVSCHGATKSNGDLRFDTLPELLKGGKHGPALKPNDATASRMIQRVHLPLEAKEHMPPKGKPQLSEEESDLLEWWIDAGAPTDKRIAELNPPALMAETIAARLGVPPVPPPDRAKMLAAAAALEAKLGIVIRPLAADAPWLAANARLQFAKFGDAQLAELARIAPALQWLDLGETAVTDAGLAALAPMKNLRRLQLDGTAITDAGLARLAGLNHLGSLNLHATKVTDAGLTPLRSLPRLRSLYLWQTGVTPEAAREFAAHQIDQRKITRLKTEIAALESSIRAEQFTLNLGEALRPIETPPATTPAPMASLAKPAATAVRTKKSKAAAKVAAPVNDK